MKLVAALIRANRVWIEDGQSAGVDDVRYLRRRLDAWT